jgi:hypothetical protein
MLDGLSHACLQWGGFNIMMITWAKTPYCSNKQYFANQHLHKWGKRSVASFPCAGTIFLREL